jgi:hypothetical protein
MIGGIEETSASFEARSAPRSYPTSEQQFSDFVKRGIAPKSVLFSRNARRFKRSDVDAWCAAGGPSAYTSKGDPGAVRR